MVSDRICYFVFSLPVFFIVFIVANIVTRYPPLFDVGNVTPVSMYTSTRPNYCKLVRFFCISFTNKISDRDCIQLKEDILSSDDFSFSDYSGLEV